MFSRFYFPLEQFFPQIVRNIMVTDYFLSIPIFSSVRKKNEKNFWDMEIIGNRRKNFFSRTKKFCLRNNFCSVFYVLKNIKKIGAIRKFLKFFLLQTMFSRF